MTSPAGGGDASREYSADTSAEVLGDPSQAAHGDVSPAAAADLSPPTSERICAWCSAPRARSGDWTWSRVHDIAKSSAYVGRYVADKRRGLVITTPRLVSDELWHLAQRMIESRKTNRSGRQHVSLCAGATCGLCGERINVHTCTNAYGTYYRHYACKARLEGRGCTLPYLLVGRIDEALWAEVVRQISDPATLAAGLRAGPDVPALEAELADFDRRLDRLEQAESRIPAGARPGKPARRRWESLGRRSTRPTRRPGSRSSAPSCPPTGTTGS